MKAVDPVSTGKGTSSPWNCPASPHVTSLLKWAKCIAFLLLIIIFFLAVIYGLLLMQLRMRDCGSQINVGHQDAVDEDAFRATSGVRRVKREDLILEVPPTPNKPCPARDESTEHILLAELQKLTSQMDRIWAKMESLPSSEGKWIYLHKKKANL